MKMRQMQKILCFVISLFLLSCTAKYKGEVFKSGYCNVTFLPPNTSNQMKIRSTSDSDEISFTVKTTIAESNKTETHTYLLGPGEETYLGCDYDGQGHKQYDIVGAKENK